MQMEASVRRGHRDACNYLEHGLKTIDEQANGSKHEREEHDAEDTSSVSQFACQTPASASLISISGC